MGFLDKLKSAAKFVTGGGAKVTLEVLEPAMDSPFKVSIKAVISDANLKVDKVYLYVRATERVTIPASEIDRTEGEDDNKPARDVTKEVETYRQEINVEGAQELSANGEYHWEAQVSLPSGLNPSYYGKHALHRYYLMAGLDAPGNDPDSGWVEARIK